MGRLAPLWTYGAPVHTGRQAKQGAWGNRAPVHIWAPGHIYGDAGAGWAALGPHTSMKVPQGRDSHMRPGHAQPAGAPSILFCSCSAACAVVT